MDASDLQSEVARTGLVVAKESKKRVKDMKKSDNEAESKRDSKARCERVMKYPYIFDVIKGGECVWKKIQNSMVL